MINVVILAAGASRRLGRPKQNPLYKDVTLLQHAITTASSVSGELSVVLGAHFDSISRTLGHINVPLLFNPDWEQGLATSVRLAVGTLRKKNVNRIMFLVCDQPLVTTEHLERLAELSAGSPKGIIATGYHGTFGVPVIFGSRYFDELMLLSGENGAKKIASAHQDDLLVVPCESGSVDVDTEQDYIQLNAI